MVGQAMEILAMLGILPAITTIATIVTAVYIWKYFTSGR